MDTSTPTQQNPTSAVNRTQPPVQAIPTPQSFSAHPEHAPIQSDTASENAANEILQPSNEAQKIEAQPTVPEVAIEKNIEHVVEKSPDTEKPQLSEAVKAAGVTLSGPGIPVDENVFGVKSLPMTYEEAVVQDKQTTMKDSKHWLAELVMYVWRKLDPTLGKKGAKN
jgi:hypothetical protein